MAADAPCPGRSHTWEALARSRSCRRGSARPVPRRPPWLPRPPSSLCRAPAGAAGSAAAPSQACPALCMLLPRSLCRWRLRSRPRCRTACWQVVRRAGREMACCVHHPRAALCAHCFLLPRRHHHRGGRRRGPGRAAGVVPLPAQAHRRLWQAEVDHRDRLPGLPAHERGVPPPERRLRGAQQLQNGQDGPGQHGEQGPCPRLLRQAASGPGGSVGSSRCRIGRRLVHPAAASATRSPTRELSQAGRAGHAEWAQDGLGRDAQRGGGRAPAGGGGPRWR